MKKSKAGFTLVELLVVISLLAILMIMVLPNVVGMFQNAKKGTFKTEVQTIMKQAQQTWMLNGGNAIIFNSKCTNAGEDGVSSAQLSLQGTSLYYVVRVNTSGNITYIAVSDGKEFGLISGTTTSTATILATDIDNSDVKTKEANSALYTSILGYANLATCATAITAPTS